MSALKSIGALAVLAIASTGAHAAGSDACIWGERAEVITRMPSGKAGFDAVLVEYVGRMKAKAPGPFFVLVPAHEAVPTCRTVRK